jgi:hypothetical protein
LVLKELSVLRERIEALEDLHDLREAVAANAGQPTEPWPAVKKRLKIG